MSLALLTTIVVGSFAAAGAPVHLRRSFAPRPVLAAFLRTYLRDKVDEADTTARYAAARVVLGRHGERAAVVYLTGQTWCGSGGCTLLVLRQEPTTYREIGWIPITRLPVGVLPGTHHGWYDLAVIGRTAHGRSDARRATLQFDGRRYHGDPSVAPRARSPGRVVVTAVSPTVRLFRFR